MSIFWNHPALSNFANKPMAGIETVGRTDHPTKRMVDAFVVAFARKKKGASKDGRLSERILCYSVRVPFQL
jgi:hypothetical protein